jgi:3',5'-cyclic AMP phosphodiesterase CpdA
MQVLHLTDLHVTQTDTLRLLWSGIRTQLDPGADIQQVDYIVISGDLTQAASEPEYETVRSFIEEYLLAHVKNGDRRRIILAPGNHDVDWSMAIGNRVAWADASPALREEAAAFERDRASYVISRPVEQQVRTFVENGVSYILQLDRYKYPLRFLNFQRAYDQFYDGPASVQPQASTLRRFRVDRFPGSHWSCHEHDDAVFLCFNSSVHNDRHWTGASFSVAALEEAAREVERIRQERRKAGREQPLLILVWHHGLGALKGMADRLSQSELGNALALKPDLVFHGHTHRDDITGRMSHNTPIIATGSFAAGSQDLPGGYRNQASVVRVGRSYIRWRRFERDGELAEWGKPSVRYYTVHDGVRPAPETSSEAALHRRRAEVDTDGTTTMKVQLERVSIRGPIPIVKSEVEILGPDDGEAHSRLRPDKVAIAYRGADSDTLLVRSEKMNDGLLYSIIPAGHEYYDRIEWSYRTTNALSLDVWDTHFSDDPNRMKANLKDREDAWSHPVRFFAERLELEVQFPEKLRVAPVAPRKDPGKRGGVCDLDDEVAQVCSDKCLYREIDDPVLGRSYLIKYRIASQQDDRRKEFASLKCVSDEVLELCRRMPVFKDGVFEKMREALEKAFDGIINERVSWTCFLWNEHERRITPAFGRFPPLSWSTRFRYGEGVAGHTFRNACWGAYHAGCGECVVFRRAPIPLEERKWILMVPILFTPPSEEVTSEAGLHSHAIGVVGLADREGFECPALSTLARVLVGPEYDSVGSEVAKMERLSCRVSYAFWYQLQRQPELSEGVRRIAASQLEAWEKEISELCGDRADGGASAVVQL